MTHISPKIILAGGSGFLGQALAKYFAARGYSILVLARNPPTGAAFPTLAWDGRTLGPWAHEFESAAAVINLAGKSVNCRYTARNRRAIMDSRLGPTRVVGQAIARCKNPPAVWLNASTATIYKHTFDRHMDELTGVIGATPEAQDAFSIEVATQWEQALADAPTPATRKVALRTAMVLGHDPNSVLPNLCRIVRLGLGGPIAGGQQFMSWIHQLDFCRAVEFLVNHAELAGPINLVAPAPLTNRDFMAALRRQLRRRIGLPTSRLMLELGAFIIRTEPELVIKSRRVIPTRLENAGFRFAFPTLELALADLLGR